MIKLVALVAVALCSACSKPEVCNGQAIETRPLTGVLADIGVPPGGIQCLGVTQDAAWIADHRTVEVGAGADAGFEAWKTHLASRGWRETTTVMELAENGIAEAAGRAGNPISSCTTYHRFKKDGVAGVVTISVGYCVDVDGPGWTQFSYLK